MKSLVYSDVGALRADLDGVIRVEANRVEVLDQEEVRGQLIDRLVWTAVFGEGETQEASRFLIRATATALDAWTASIHDLYMAAGRRDYANITTPAINVRGMAYDMARRIFRAAEVTGSKQILFELARSETGYTDQRPGEYASVVLAAAIKEGYSGPVMIQGDHYQADAAKYAENPEAEIRGVRELAIEAIQAGYGNIDIDASTLVDLSRDSLLDQQRENYVHTAELTRAIREAEPEGITISVGGEIGEVGKENSTVQDLEAFMTGYQQEMERLSEEAGRKLVGISKISVQTGTSHGGVMMPDGTMQEVSVDFGTLASLSAASKDEYGLGGDVQHGASTLPESAFGAFAESDAVEVHLATGFQNIIYDHPAFPEALKQRIYGYLTEHRASERKPDENDDQFYYKTRKRGFGPFKKELWSLPEETRATIGDALQERFELIMRELRVAGNAHLVDHHIKRVDVVTPAPEALIRAE
ncbi:MAG: class II fructose-bisphosphate aldolase [Chloroflexia bacterium]|nr:class II fructose-bisphosphate aldolase [Chloroflexia bacterium]